MAGRISVLLVDDEPALAKLYGTAIQRRGLNAMATIDAEDAIDIIARYRPKLVVSDVQMPAMSGFDLCRRLQALNAKSGPVIFLTGYDDSSVVAEGLEAGGDDFVSKSGSIAELLARAQFWLRSSFTGLPAGARHALAEHLKAGKTGPALSLAEDSRLDEELVEAVAEEVLAECQSLGADFGARLVERIAILGRIDALLLSMASQASVYLRFADHVSAVIKQLDYEWAPDATILFSRYDSLRQDARFRGAADGLRTL